MNAGVEVLELAVRNHSRLPERHQKLARVKEWSPYTRLQREHGPPDILISDSRLQNYDITYFCCFKLPSLRYFVMAALGNKYTLFGQPDSQKWSKLAELSKQQGTCRILIPYTEFWEGAAGQAGALIYRVSFRLKPECTRREKLQALLLNTDSYQRYEGKKQIRGIWKIFLGGWAPDHESYSPSFLFWYNSFSGTKLCPNFTQASWEGEGN